MVAWAMGTIAIMHKKSTHAKLRLAIVEKRAFLLGAVE